jgi:indolepyruvate ferredoxin oxidoreductase beta subunit
MAGVGGQGILRATDILTSVAMAHGLDAKKTEIHGTAQRGGMVYSHVRFGEEIYSPVIRRGMADSLIICEELEALRWAEYLKPEGHLILHPVKIVPPMVTLGWFTYPKNIIDRLRERNIRLTLVEAGAIAKTLGNARLTNMVLLGVQSRFLDFSVDVWGRQIRRHVPQGTETLNVKAFMMGRDVVT